MKANLASYKKQAQNAARMSLFPNVVSTPERKCISGPE
jgi:hypothetical protein